MAKKQILNRILTSYDDQPFVMDGYPTERPVPVVDRAGAIAMMATHADQDPGVFWDRGWGDSGNPLMISVILNGNGQNPIGFITRDTYDELLSQKDIGPNGLHTLKARRWHAFNGEGSATPPASLPGCGCRVCRGQS